jgi:hypothetical protein
MNFGNLSYGRGLWLTIFFCFPVLLMGSESAQHVGILVKKKGKVEIFSHPSTSAQGPSPRALFEGTYYTVREARLGSKLLPGNILRTAVNAQAKIVYLNGDQIHVGKGTSYRVFRPSSEKKQQQSPSLLKLMYGKIRAVVSKKGPRNNMEVQTKRAAMAVRGTDFYLKAGGSEKETQLTVLRGKVLLKPRTVLNKKGPRWKKGIEIRSGHTVNVQEKAMKLNQVDRQELQEITQQSTIKKEDKEEQGKVAPSMATIITKLEKRASKVILEDIREEDPQLYQTLKRSQVEDADQLNQQVVLKRETLVPAKKRPLLIDLESDQSDVYEKYYERFQK